MNYLALAIAFVGWLLIRDILKSYRACKNFPTQLRNRIN